MCEDCSEAIGGSITGENKLFVVVVVNQQLWRLQHILCLFESIVLGQLPYPRYPLSEQVVQWCQNGVQIVQEFSIEVY